MRLSEQGKMDFDINQITAWLNEGTNIITAISATTGLSAATILAFALALGETVLKKAIKWLLIILAVSAIVYVLSQGMLDSIINQFLTAIGI